MYNFLNAAIYRYFLLTWKYIVAPNIERTFVMITEALILKLVEYWYMILIWMFTFMFLCKILLDDIKNLNKAMSPFEFFSCIVCSHAETERKRRRRCWLYCPWFWSRTLHFIILDSFYFLFICIVDFRQVITLIHCI